MALFAPGAKSHAQFGQDVFALLYLGFKREGFFVEFGATNGVDLSNSYLLETHFGWTGILAEPGRNWHAALAENRRAAIDHDCVWSRSGETIAFLESSEPELSTAQSYANTDGRGRDKRDAARYEVTTVSLNDLLDRHGAPQVIDYLSIDTEGSELEILSAHDFDRHQFRVITVEHNFTRERVALYDLLTAKGYERVLSGASYCDDWYVLSGT